jgi:hypothetical protein
MAIGPRACEYEPTTPDHRAKRPFIEYLYHRQISLRHLYTIGAIFVLVMKDGFLVSCFCGLLSSGTG